MSVFLIVIVGLKIVMNVTFELNICPLTLDLFVISIIYLLVFNFPAWEIIMWMYNQIIQLIENQKQRS